MNMSYCRFHNTVIDVRDCLDALCYDEEKLSEEEMPSVSRCSPLMGLYLSKQ